MSALDRWRQLNLLQQTGLYVPINNNTTAKEEPMDISATLKNDVAAAFRNRAEQAERKAAAEPRPFAAATARANASVYRACANACANGRMPLVTGTRLVPGLPPAFDAVQREACRAGMTECISSDHPEG